MNESLFKGKYRIKSIRLPSWNYCREGFYFVTICIKGMEEFFGEIKNGIMGLNELGCLAAKSWQLIPDYFDDVVLDEWVASPIIKIPGYIKHPYPE